MRTRRVDQPDDGKVWFVIDGIPVGSPLEDAARHMEFVEFDGGVARSFPASSGFIDEAYAGFSLLGPAMLEHHAADGATRWEDALTTTLRRAESAGVGLFLVGSGAIAVHGARVVPGDIDLVVSDEDARRLAEEFVDVLVEPLTPTDGWISRWFSRAFLDGCRVEWAGGVETWADDSAPTDFGPVALDHSIELLWRGHTVRVPPLDLLRDVNLRRGRHDRVAAIDALAG